MSFDIPPSQRDQTLPMAMILRGDEAIVDEFTFDSDQAMDYLGIKRSRLSQISGRELRVARVRRDRYVRPVYREADLKDYLDWTRATATHLSSSKAIEQAVENLDDRFNDILQVLNERLGVYGREQQSLFRRELEQLPARLRGAEKEPETERPLHDQGKLLRKLESALQAQGEKIGKLELVLDTLQALVGQLSPEWREVSVALRSLRGEWQDGQAILKDELKALSEAIDHENQQHFYQLQLIKTEITEEFAQMLAIATVRTEEPRRPQRKLTSRARRSYWR